MKDSRVEQLLNRSPKEPPPKDPQKKTALDWIVNRNLQDDPTNQSEIQRICRLPISEPLTDDEIEAVNQMYVKGDALASGFRLQKVQAEAIQTFAELGTVFGPIEVGGGKTLICLRCISLAFEKGTVQRAVLFVPPNVCAQLVEHDIGWARKRVPLGLSFHVLAGKSPARRRAMVGGRKGCWIMPYSLLQAEDAWTLLEELRPDLLFFDEAHNIKNKRAARTSRILSYWRKYRPAVSALSGTMTRKSLKDYAHILLMCLGQKSPLPTDMSIVEGWANVLDSAQAQHEYHDKTTSAGPLRPLINWSNHHFPLSPLSFDVPGFRRAYQNRLLTAPGVVSSPADALGTSLVIENRKVDGAGDELKRLTKQLLDLWVTPDGDEIEHAMLVWKWRTELTAGFYHRHFWPTAEQLSIHRKITVDQAADFIARSQSHHKKLQEYHRELRKWFKNNPSVPHMDSPMLVGKEMSKNQDTRVGRVLYTAWRQAKDAEFPEMVEREKAPVRVDDYKIKAAVEWADKNTRSDGIIWYFNQEIGVWVTEELKKKGIPCIHCPAGKDVDIFLTKPDVADRCRGHFLVASLKAHGTGKNLQFLHDQLFLQLPWTEDQAQQTIGRTHRTGQLADVVNVTTLVSNDTDELQLAAILNDSMYVFETSASRRKVLIATWNPMPSVFGSSVLIRAGIQAKVLTARQQQMLGERFSR